MASMQDAKSGIVEALEESLGVLPCDGEGKLIVFCGFDGCGKSTQIERLARNLEAAGKSVLITKQPSDWYRESRIVRDFLAKGGCATKAKILALYAAADRLKHVHEVILPAVRAGKHVICDRYVYSSIA